MMDLCLSLSSCNFSGFKTLLYFQFARGGTTVKWFELGRGGWHLNRDYKQLVQDPGKDLPTWWRCNVKFEQQSTRLSCEVTFCAVAAVLLYRNKHLIPWSQCVLQNLSFIFLDSIYFDKMHERPVEPLPSYFHAYLSLANSHLRKFVDETNGWHGSTHPLPLFYLSNG